MEAIEKGVFDSPEIDDLLHCHIDDMINAGADHIVLGCTHYPVSYTHLDVYKRQVYGSLMSHSGYGSAMHIDILNRWQKPGDITEVPRIDTTKNPNQNAGSSRWLTSEMCIRDRVDGVPFDAISNLNADDIENITILKDAASSALYGSRAANGVVLVTTKKGRSEKVQFNVRVNQGISMRAIQEYERLDPYQYYPMEWEALRNAYLSADGSTYTMETASAAASKNIFG